MGRMRQTAPNITPPEALGNTFSQDHPSMVEYLDLTRRSSAGNRAARTQRFKIEIRVAYWHEVGMKSNEAHSH